MSGLFVALSTASNSMKSVERSIAVVQNNVANASTPGYARTRHIPTADRFDPAQGLYGGVRPGEVISYRNRFVEEAVRERTSQNSRHNESAQLMAQLESVAQVTADAGIAGAMNRFFASASQLTVAPNDLNARQIMLERATDLATSFNLAAGTVDAVRTEAGTRVDAAVQRVNQLAGRLAELNEARRNRLPDSQDSGLDAAMANTLEELSSVVNIKALEQADGSVSVFIGGNRLLAIGANAYPVQAGQDGTNRAVLDSEGVDITRYLTGGELGAALDTFNRGVPDIQNDLNTLAESVATEINFALQAGEDLDGATPGADLFTFDGAGSAAGSLRRNDITPRQLALAAPGESGGNGNAVSLVEVGRRRQSNGYTFSESLGLLAGRVGRAIGDATEQAETSSQVLAQAKAQRQEQSGVSLDEEAAQLIQYQRAYQAAAQMFRTLNEMTQAVIDMAR